MSSPLKKEAVPSQTSSTTGHANTGPQTTPAKRSASDDEVQFVFSNPVKKRRVTGQGPVGAQSQVALKTQSPVPEQKLPLPPHAASLDRCHSTGTVVRPKHLDPDAQPENRGASLPVLENFVFPQSFSPASARPPRLSEAVSPKQLPQTLSSSSAEDVSPNRPTSNAPDPGGPAPQNSVTLDQISCLDFCGVPTNSPGFDVNRIFSAGGGLLGAAGLAAAPSPAQMQPPLNLIPNHSAIPFAMYSTGNIVPMPQTPQYGGQPPGPFFSASLGAQSHNDGVCAASALAKPQPQGFADSQHSQGQPQPRAQPSSGSSSSPAAPSKPPCIHCARIRQENLSRRAQGSAPLPGNAAQPYHSASQQPGFSSPAMSAASGHLAPPSHAQTMSVPRSVPAVAGQPAEARQHYHPAQDLPGRFPAAGAYPSLNPAPAPGPALPPAPAPAPTSSVPPSTRGLLQDMAETVQATFPYAQIAARHGLSPAKVADVLSSAVIAPLLRGALRPPGQG